MPDRAVVKDTMLTVQAVFCHILTGQPPLGSQIGKISCIQEAVISGVRPESFQCKGENRENTGKEGQDNHNNGNPVFSDSAQINLGELS